MSESIDAIGKTGNTLPPTHEEKLLDKKKQMYWVNGFNTGQIGQLLNGSFTHTSMEG